MTGSGGWPLNVFLTPEQVPFYAGTYFPPEPRMGMPSWRQVLEAVAHAWQEQAATRSARAARASPSACAAARCCARRRTRWTDERSTRRWRACARSYDAANGGFGGAPKFPPASALELLLRRGETRDERAHAARDGLGRDVRPGRRRLRALLGRPLLARPPLREDALRQRAARPRLPARVAGARRRALSRRLRGDARLGPARRCAAPRAASSRRSTPTPRASRASSTSGRSRSCAPRSRASPTPTRRSPGSAPPSAATSRAATSRCAARDGRSGWTTGAGSLYEVRAQRVWPGLDDKRLTSWNALMITRARRGGRGARAAGLPGGGRRAARSSCWARCATPTAGCCAPGRTAQAKLNAYLEDHAYLLEALLTLYEASFDPRWFAEARALADTMIERFADEENGGFFETSSDHERAARAPQGPRGPPDPVRQRERRLRPAAPGGADRRARLRGARRGRCCGCCTSWRPKHPQAFGHLLQAMDFHLAPVKEVALVGDDPSALAACGARRGSARTWCSPAARPTACRCSRTARPWTAGRPPTCASSFACKAPVTEPEELERLLS